MTISVVELVKSIEPQNTVLLFGAGASIPSGAPTVNDLIQAFSKKFSVANNDYSLSEIASLCELKASRSDLIAELRNHIRKLQPKGSLKNLPLYPWKSIFTTNYDTLVEQSYGLRERNLRVYDSNFCFTASPANEVCSLFKIHGTIEKDISDGHNSRIILSESDYEQTSDYRDYLYDRLKGDLAGASLIIIGHSLADNHIKEIVNRAAKLNEQSLAPARIFTLMYSKDANRADLLEQRGIKSAFGSIDDFFAAMSAESSENLPTQEDTNTPLEAIVALRPVTHDVGEEVTKNPDISGMFNGKPASLADVDAGHTFARTVTKEIVDYLSKEDTLCATILGGSGVGKTTAARQVLNTFRQQGYQCFEHLPDHALSDSDWVEAANWLKEHNQLGVLFVDDAHSHLYSLNDLIDKLVALDNPHLKFVLCSARNHWFPRVKTPNIFKYGIDFLVSKLSPPEINDLLSLVDQNAEINKLAEEQFSGFSRQERRRRLIDRCEADMFVCLKNIFATSSFDDIILREYADLDEPLQNIYRHVAALESAGVHVHRQLIIRLLGVEPSKTAQILSLLTDIVDEYTVSERQGIYGWRCRHNVIAKIVSDYKFCDQEKIIQLFDLVIDCISPTYEIEIRSLRELCNVKSGIMRIPDKTIQNRLLRKMMSTAPGERIPRHRLIRNLIDQGDFEKAEAEIRIFENDFFADGPTHRYKIKLLIARAIRTKGILTEDRVKILKDAHALAMVAANKFSQNKNILDTYAELGIEYYRLTGEYAIYDEAMQKLNLAEEQLGDPQISDIIRRYQRRIAGQAVEAEKQASEALDATE